MSMMELLVRPFVARNVAPIPLAVSGSQVTPTDAILLFGSEDTHIFKYDQGRSIYYQIEKSTDFNEYTRLYHVVRVENPDDSNQYVDVERIDNIKFRNPKADPTKPKATDEMNLTYNND